VLTVRHRRGRPRSCGGRALTWEFADLLMWMLIAGAAMNSGSVSPVTGDRAAAAVTTAAPD